MEIANARDRRILRQLELVARDMVPCGNARVAAMLTQGNEVLGMGHNQYKTHPLQARFGDARWPYLHAEIDTLRNAINRYPLIDFPRTTMYIVRARANDLGLARPCPGCMRALNHYKIGRIIWSE